jgi:membrane protease subunit HflC
MRTFRKLTLIALGVVALACLVARACVVVDETEYVLVTDFGRPVALYGEGQSGLHGKWPWQSALGIDRRLHVFDPPAREMITGDKRNLEVSSYVVWRVIDPSRFLRAAGSLEAAEARLEERVSAVVSSALGRRTLASLASTDANVWALDRIAAEVARALESPARDELGVQVVDVRLRRFNHPLEVRPAVFDLIRSERRQVAASLRAEGEAQYQTITSQADRERDSILARADAEAERIKSQGEAESTRLLNEAHARDPRFYEFVRTLETYKAIFDDKTTVVLSSTSPLLRLLTQGPPDELLKETRPGPVASPPAPAAGASLNPATGP